MAKKLEQPYLTPDEWDRLREVLAYAIRLLEQSEVERSFHLESCQLATWKDIERKLSDG